MRKFIETTKSLLSLIWDKLVLHTPIHLVYRLRQPGVAFLVHPRDVSDIYRPYPLFSVLPTKVTRFLGCKFGAITLSKITTQKDITGASVRSYLLSIVMDPESMRSKKAILQKNTAQLSLLAERKNLKLIALGALLPSVTSYGTTLVGLQDQRKYAPAVTTGHVATAWCVQAIFTKIALARHPSKSGFCVGVLGAAGSTGSLTTKMLGRLQTDHGWEFSLVLVDKSKARLKRLSNQVKVPFVGTEQISALKHCDYVIVVTNSSNFVLNPDFVKENSVVIDDTQPRATTPELLHKAFVVDVLARVPGLNANFDFGIMDPDPSVTFSCMAEMMVLGTVGHTGNFAIGPGAKASLDGPDKIIDRFFSYLEIAKQKGLVIEPVTNVSFAKTMSLSSHQLMLTPQVGRSIAA